MLLLNYMSSRLSRYDEAVRKHFRLEKMKEGQVRTLLKQMVAVGLVESPSALLEWAQLPTNRFILLKAYLLFKHLDSREALQ